MVNFSVNSELLKTLIFSLIFWDITEGREGAVVD
jgi:hypothetical protein